MSRTGSIASRATARFGIALVLLFGGLAMPANADPLVCATITYEKFNGPKTPVVDDCWVPTPWPASMGTGPDDCYGPPQIIRICEGTEIASP